MLRLVGKSLSVLKAEFTLTLPWEQRVRSRLRVTLDNGMAAGLFLARGAVLRGGDILLSEEGRAVLVRAAPELLSTVRCADSLRLARLCYHLGNRHVELQIGEALVRYRHDHVLDRMVESMGHAVVIEHEPFEPEAGAYGGGDSGHGHQHGA